MEENTQSHLYYQKTARDQHGEDLTRQDYSIRVSDGRTSVVPNAFEEVELPLAMSLKPNVSKALDMPGGPGVTMRKFSTLMAGGLVEARVDPGHSQRELHLLHAEVKALQDTLGISYKDATHRLFLAEVERVKKADSAAKSFTAIRRTLDSLITADIVPAIHAIDNGRLDDYIWRDGQWSKE